MPRSWLPAIGWDPTKLTPRGSSPGSVSKTAPFTLPTSVTIAPASIAGSIRSSTLGMA